MISKRSSHEIRKDFFYLQCIYEGTHKRPICLSPPMEVPIEVTNRCNLKCSHCGHEVMKRKKENMSLELFKKIIDDVAFFQPYIDFHLQGEPLLNKHLPKMVAYAKKHNLDTRLITNTTLLTREKSKELLATGLDYICFSFSAVTKKTYERVHVNGNFEMTLNNILDFLEVEDEMGRIIRTRTIFVEEERTAQEKDKYLEMFGKLPIDSVSVSPMFNFFGKNKESDLSEFHRLPREKWPVCTFPWKVLSIGSNGEIRACFVDYEHRYVVGNAKDDNVIDAWNSPAMQEYRRALLEKNYEGIEKKGPLCTQCNQIWEMDQHGCTSQWPADFCGDIKNFFEKGTRLFTTNVDSLRPKFKYLRNRRNEFLDEMVSL
ncbi:MAG: radical SAM protein [Phycisphaerales bacterium]|nr:MAG: radical SAM protein [Phycisphaerales bacterium]